ncbi:MAG: PilN domain-containing protein [Dongiaceae bacterium]
MIAVTDTIARFFDWWFGELAACVPDRLRRLFRRESAVLELASGDGDLGLALRQDGRRRHLGVIRRGTATEPRRELARLLRGVSLQDVDIVMNLPADRVLERRVSLPLAAAENLREVLAFEMDRHTPFKADEVAFDYRIIGTDAEAKRINVDLAVAPRALLEQAARVAASLGLAMDRIGIAGTDSQAGRSYNFLPNGGTTGRSMAQRRLSIALAVLAAILAAIAVYLPLYIKQTNLAEHEARLAEARAAALDADRLKTRLAASLEHNRFLIDRRLSMPAATALLAEVTRLLPDDTWLVQMRWQGDKLVLAGFSPSAAALIAGLEDSPILADVRFGSPVTVDPRVGRERFNISADVAAGPGG